MALDHTTGRIAVGELLSNQVATTNGVWYPLGGKQPVSITVEDTVGSAFVGTVRLHVSNRDAQPAAADVGSLIGDDITSLPQCLQFQQSWRWIKASVPAYTSGTLKTVGLWAGPGA
jgi:hypothetical protein